VNARMTFAEMCRKKMEAMNDKERTRTMNGSLQTEVKDSIQGKDWIETYTRSPGESSVYSLSIVFDEPPAPAARDEFGRETCDAPAARRLQRMVNRLVNRVLNYRNM